MTALELPCTDYILLVMDIHGAANTEYHKEDKELLRHCFFVALAM